MLITLGVGLGAITFVPFEDVRLPDYGNRRIELMETVEMERVLIDKGGNRIGMQFQVAGVLKQTDLNALEGLTAAAVGTYTHTEVDISSAGVSVWSGDGYITRVGDVTLIAGKVLFADAALGFAQGDTLCRATIELMYKE